MTTANKANAPVLRATRSGVLGDEEQTVSDYAKGFGVSVCAATHAVESLLQSVDM